MRDYPRLSGGEPRATWVGEHTREICELLVETGFESPAVLLDERVAYHDACHLAHACGIREPPRTVVQAATGRRPIDLGENEICCGSAGSYNLDRPRLAKALGLRKAKLAESIDVDTIAAGNAGCLLQIEKALSLRGLALRTVHPVDLLAAAYRASEANDSSS